MNIDWNATVAWVAFGVAVITPCVTTYLNNRFQFKLKKLELNHKSNEDSLSEMSSAYTTYLEVTSRILIENRYVDDLVSYSVAYHKIFLYAQPDLYPLLEELNQKISSKNYDDSSKALFLNITKILSDKLNRMRPLSKL